MNAPHAHEPLTQALPDLRRWTTYFEDAEIPVLAASAHQLEQWRENEDAVDAHLIGEAFSNDPLMTLKVLSFASAQRSGRLLADAETVTAAIVLLGITPFFTAFGQQPTIEDRLAGQPEAFGGLQRVLRRAERAARFALGFAVHRTDPDAQVIHSAALLHDFAEMLLWCYPPQLALRIQHAQRVDPSLRSTVAQRAVLNIELGDLEQALMRSWRLPELLRHITDDKRGHDPQVQCVRLAVRLARHTADSWGNPAVPDDLKEISDLLNLNPEHTLILLQDLDSGR